MIFHHQHLSGFTYLSPHLQISTSSNSQINQPIINTFLVFTYLPPPSSNQHIFKFSNRSANQHIITPVFIYPSPFWLLAYYFWLLSSHQLINFSLTLPVQKIILLSDTHNYFDPKITKYLQEADEIWHAGDIGTYSICEELLKHKPLRAVYGNIDGQDIRKSYPKDLVFNCEQVKVFMTHIGGYPQRYNAEAKKIIQEEKPKLFICGHSHILKVMYDQQYELLHINPGAAGNHGFHKVKTMVRFTIDGQDIKELAVIELGERV